MFAVGSSSSREWSSHPLVWRILGGCEVDALYARQPDNQNMD